MDYPIKKIVIFTLWLIVLLPATIHCSKPEYSLAYAKEDLHEYGLSVTLREYIERILNERDKALAIGQNSLDSRFVRIEQFLKDTGVYNDKINRLNENMANNSIKFNDQINKLSDRVTIIETKSIQNADIARNNIASSRNWIIGIGLLFTAIQVIIQVLNRKKD